jgi:hypothetical protein
MAGIHRKTKLHVNKTIQIIKRRLMAVISILGVGVAVLFFRIGEPWWPQGLMDYRLRIIGVLVFALLIVTASFPLFIESAKRPRTYPGLGKNPYIDR